MPNQRSFNSCGSLVTTGSKWIGFFKGVSGSLSAAISVSLCSLAKEQSVTSINTCYYTTTAFLLQQVNQT